MDSNNNNNNSNLFNDENQFSAYSYYGHANYDNSNNAGAPAPMKPKKDHKGGRIVALVLCICLVVAGAGFGGVFVGSRLADLLPDRVVSSEPKPTVEANSEKTEVKVTQTTNSDNTMAYMSDVSGIVENVMPSIVAINCTGEYVTSFWGQQFTQETGGSGSGIIIGQNNEEVLIATNNHVVSLQGEVKNKQIEVVFGDDSSVEGIVKGTEAGSDLAVVSVKLADISQDTLDYIKIATLGDSDSLKVGQMAIAIGNALGYGQSTTVGYISALHRTVAAEDYTMELIQTDAAINPGNSGGALLNVRGEVIGINSAKYSDESVEGMGFAIPISDAIPIINDLMNREEIPESEQAYLGIIGQNVTEAYNEAYGMPIGVYVYQVTQGSPAAKAGLNMGDIITEFNGRTIETMTDLQGILATYRYGEEVTLTIQVFENGEYKEQILNVTLGRKGSN